MAIKINNQKDSILLVVSRNLMMHGKRDDCEVCMNSVYQEDNGPSALENFVPPRQG